MQDYSSFFLGCCCLSPWPWLATEASGGQVPWRAALMHSLKGSAGISPPLHSKTQEMQLCVHLSHHLCCLHHPEFSRGPQPHGKLSPSLAAFPVTQLINGKLTELALTAVPSPSSPMPFPAKGAQRWDSKWSSWETSYCQREYQSPFLQTPPTLPVMLLESPLDFGEEKQRLPFFPFLHEHTPPPKALGHPPTYVFQSSSYSPRGRRGRSQNWGVVGGRVTPLNCHFLVKPAGRGLVPTAGTSSSLRSKEFVISYHQLCALAPNPGKLTGHIVTHRTKWTADLSHPCHPLLSS